MRPVDNYEEKICETKGDSTFLFHKLGRKMSKESKFLIYKFDDLACFLRENVIDYKI